MVKLSVVCTFSIKMIHCRLKGSDYLFYITIVTNNSVRFWFLWRFFRFDKPAISSSLPRMERVMVHRLWAFIETVKAAMPVCLDAANLFTVCSRVRSTGLLEKYLLDRGERIPHVLDRNTPPESYWKFEFTILHFKSLLNDVSPLLELRPFRTP